MSTKINWVKAIVSIVAITCIFMSGFIVARSTSQNNTVLHKNVPESLTKPTIQICKLIDEPEPPAELTTQPQDVMWQEFNEMTLNDMRQSITEYGAAAFEDATGMDITFDNPDNIISINEPHVMARGYSNGMQAHIHVLFTLNWRGSWRVDGYSIWDRWNMQPQVTRGMWQGRRYVNAYNVDVRFYGIVDWGGGAIAPPVYMNISGENFADEFIDLFQEHVGIKMLDMWFIGDKRLYVNLDAAVMYAQGSAAGFAALVSMHRTLFSIPDVEEVVVLVEGQSEAMSDHIGFSPISNRNDPEVQLWLKLPQW